MVWFDVHYNLRDFLIRDVNCFIPIKFYRSGLILALLMFVMFAPLDYALIEDRSHLLSVMLIKCFCSVLMLAIAIGAASKRRLLRYLQHVGLACSLSIGISHVFIQQILYTSDERMGAFYFTGLILIVTLAPSLFWLSRIYSLLFNLAVLVCFNIIVVPRLNMPLPYLFELNLELMSGASIGTFSRFCIIDLIERNYKKSELLKAKDKALSDTNARLQESNAFKQNILSILSHDIKGPLNSLRGIISLNEKKVISGDDLHKHLKHIDQSIAITNGLVDEILEWSKPAFDSRLTKEILISDCVEQVFLLYATHAAEKNIVLKNLAGATVSSGDANLISLLLRNLISNAIKFTDTGTIVVSANNDYRYLVISVEDTGIGMDEYVAESIFKNQKRCTTTGTRSEKGTGIGLLMCRQMLRQRGGDLSYSRISGGGSKFTFLLPID